MRVGVCVVPCVWVLCCVRALRVCLTVRLCVCACLVAVCISCVFVRIASVCILCMLARAPVVCLYISVCLSVFIQLCSYMPVCFELGDAGRCYISLVPFKCVLLAGVHLL